jgi:hypothetical protein
LPVSRSVVVRASPLTEVWYNGTRIIGGIEMITTATFA